MGKRGPQKGYKVPGRINLEDQIFGKLIVIDKAPPKKGGHAWNCLCECGDMCVAIQSYLLSGRKVHCGSYKCSKYKRRDLTDKRFGRLLVLHEGEPSYTPDGRKRHTWTCLCDCGAIKDIRVDALTSSRTNSCGCILKEWRKSQKQLTVERKLKSKKNEKESESRRP